MIIGVPTEIKKNQFAVGLTPASVKMLVDDGHCVFIQSGAGNISGYDDLLYQKVGAKICETAQEIYQNAKLIVKISEPQICEHDLLVQGQILFSKLNLPYNKELANVLLQKEITAIAHEEVKTAEGLRPLIEPLDEIVGNLSVQIGAYYLQKLPQIPVSKGILLGGSVGIGSAKVCILGAGTIGANAAKTASGYGASVVILDSDLNKLKNLENNFGGKIQTLFANEYNITKTIKNTDLLICTIRFDDEKSKVLISENLIKTMKSGSVVIDSDSEFGSIVETINEFTENNSSVVVKNDVIHYRSNIASMVPRASTIALNNAMAPYIKILAENENIISALKSSQELRNGVVTYHGELTIETIARLLDIKFTELSLLIGF